MVRFLHFGPEFVTMIIGINVVLFLPPIILLIVGLVQLFKKKSSAKVYLIIAVVYLLVSGGMCASFLNGGL